MNTLTFEKVWDDLLDTLEVGEVIYTLARKNPNEITSINIAGIEVMTNKSSPKSELVPKWMFEIAVSHLIENRYLLNTKLQNDLNVKRSSFVMAALSKLDYIDYEIDPPKIILK